MKGKEEKRKGRLTGKKGTGRKNRVNEGAEVGIGREETGAGAGIARSGEVEAEVESEREIEREAEVGREREAEARTGRGEAGAQRGGKEALTSLEGE